MAPGNYSLVGSIEELSVSCARLLDGDGAIGFDIETGYRGPDAEKHSLHPETAHIVGISFTNDVTWAQYAPLGHDFDPNLDNREAARLLWPVLNSGRGVAHNAPFELRHLSRWFMEHLVDDPDYGEQVRACNGYFPIRSDTQVEAYLVAEYKHFGLKPLTEAMFGHKMTELHELFPGLAKNKRKFLRFNILELTEKVRDYACEDAVWCLAIHRRYYERQVQGPTGDMVPLKDHLLYRTEMAILEVICEMEDYGVRYDWRFMREGAESVRDFRDQVNGEIMAELSRLTRETVAINLGSPLQVRDVLYGKLGLTTTVYTDKTKDLPADQRVMSTGKIALTGLAKKHPVVKMITEWKELKRLGGTYLEKYEGLYGYAADGHTHPHYLSAVVVTGRFAVADPPVQQSPKKYHFDLAPAREAHAAHVEAHGKKCDCGEFPAPPGTCFKMNFRDAIVAPPEHYILGFDLSQAELRAIAGEANETALLRAFEVGDDVHSLTASLMLRVPFDQVTEDHRDVGKTMNFALLYGMSVKGLADRLGLSVEEAKALYDAYFAAYPGIAVWKEKQIRFGQTNGYVTSRFGRRLPIWNYQSEKRWVRQGGDRQCVNFPIQGAATGDYVKIGMVRARNALRKAGLSDRVHLVMNVHDALEFYVHQSVDPADVVRVLQPEVIFAVKGWPAMQADWHLAKRWGSPRKIEVRDGRLFVKGEQEIELKPAVEEDEDGEEVEVMPEVDEAALREAVSLVKAAPVQPPPPSVTSSVPVGEPDADAGGGKHVIVDMPAMPTPDGFRRFRGLVQNRPGPNTLTVRTPDGEFDMDLTTTLSPRDVAQVSMLLGPVRIVYDVSDVDSSALMAGLAL